MCMQAKAPSLSFKKDGKVSKSSCWKSIAAGAAADDSAAADTAGTAVAVRTHQGCFLVVEEDHHYHLVGKSADDHSQGELLVQGPGETAVVVVDHGCYMDRRRHGLKEIHSCCCY